ncbi:MAG: PIN domain-containing protein, partial [Treponema sp.]|nr:PIN domain-containing protein [Treponema sp.]
MRQFVLDTNIISFYLRENQQIIQTIEKTRTEGDDIIIPPFAYYEIKRGLTFIGAVKKLRDFEHFCALMQIGNFENSQLEIAVDIYIELLKKGINIDDADIFIAAFCRQHNGILVTNNTDHFRGIKG